MELPANVILGAFLSFTLSRTFCVLTFSFVGTIVGLVAVVSFPFVRTLIGTVVVGVAPLLVVSLANGAADPWVPGVTLCRADN